MAGRVPPNTGAAGWAQIMPLKINIPPDVYDKAKFQKLFRQVELWAATMENADKNIHAAVGVSTPASGATNAVLLFGTTDGFGIYFGSGAPTVSAGKGSFYLRSDGSSTSTRLYVNSDGGTTWTAVTTAA